MENFLKTIDEKYTFLTWDWYKTNLAVVPENTRVEVLLSLQNSGLL